MNESRLSRRRHFHRRWEGVRVGIWVIGLAILLVSGAGCAKARAASVPDGPPLHVPTPPERVLAPVEEPPLLAVEPEPEPPTAAVAPPRPARPTPEPKPAPPAAAAPATLPPPAPSAPPRDLRPGSPPNAVAPTERGIRDLLARAARDINQVNYSRLSTEGRSQYQQSKRFSIQAEQALQERNLIFAETLADKAATLAAELLGR